jgi:hypothetical protein
MSTRKGRPDRCGLLDSSAKTDQLHLNVRPIERPETIDQAKRWDVQKSRAIAHGLCEKCAGQYCWGLQIGFIHSRPPCCECAAIIAVTSGEARPNGWVNMRFTDVGTDDTREAPRAYRSRHTTPEKYLHGYGTCHCGTAWSGYAVAHCAGCHCTFADERAFATHRVRGRCQDPEARGLVKIARAHWVGWGWPKQRDRLERHRG